MIKNVVMLWKKAILTLFKLETASQQPGCTFYLWENSYRKFQPLKDATEVIWIEVIHYFSSMISRISLNAFCDCSRIKI